MKQIKSQSPGSRLFTSRLHPIHYLVIPKCGCTFVKNFLWQLEYEVHHQPLRIHDADGQFLRASDLGLDPAEIMRREHAFVVLRNPVDRFFSLYTDKVIGPGHKNFVPLRRILAEDHGLDISANSSRAHRENCRILIAWLARNLQNPGPLDNDAHWTPQAYRKNIMKLFDLKLLLLGQLNTQLSFLLHGLIPDVADRLTGLERNRSGQGIDRKEILDTELRRRINDVYSADRKLYNRARKGWQKLDLSVDAIENIPRYGDL